MFDHGARSDCCFRNGVDWWRRVCGCRGSAWCDKDPDKSCSFWQHNTIPPIDPTHSSDQGAHDHGIEGQIITMLPSSSSKYYFLQGRQSLR